MSDLFTILNNRRGPAVLQYHQMDGSAARRAPGKTAEAPRDADRVDLSDSARALIQEPSDPRFRPDLVALARESIGRGDYLTPEKIDFVVDRLHELLTQ